MGFKENAPKNVLAGVFGGGGIDPNHMTENEVFVAKRKAPGGFQGSLGPWTTPLGASRPPSRPGGVGSLPGERPPDLGGLSLRFTLNCFPHVPHKRSVEVWRS